MFLSEKVMNGMGITNMFRIEFLTHYMFSTTAGFRSCSMVITWCLLVLNSLCTTSLQQFLTLASIRDKVHVIFWHCAQWKNSYS